MIEAMRILKPGGEIIIVEPMLLESRASLSDNVLQMARQVDQGMVLTVASLYDLGRVFEKLNLEIIDKRNVTANTLPSMQLAAASAEDHDEENVPEAIGDHRKAAIASVNRFSPG